MEQEPMYLRLPGRSFWLGMGILMAACTAPSPGASGIEPPLAAPVATSAPTLPTATFLPPTPVPTVTAIPPPTATTVPTTTPATPIAPPAPANDFGPAPEIKTEVWLNSDQPLRLADLRGKVVLVDFWTFG